MLPFHYLSTEGISSIGICKDVMNLHISLSELESHESKICGLFAVVPIRLSTSKAVCSVKMKTLINSARALGEPVTFPLPALMALPSALHLVNLEQKKPL